jgi:hypothetical protein
MLVSADVLRRLGAVVETISLAMWQDPGQRFATAWKVKQFAPDLVLSLPNAGYALQFTDSSEEEANNLFTDILSIPLVLPWDHVLTQAPIYFVRDCLNSEPARRGALATISSRLNKRLHHHFFFDSGHVNAYEDLGLLPRGRWKTSLEPAHEHFIEQGKSPRVAEVTDRVGFSGNIYSRKAGTARSSFITCLKRRVIEAKCCRWTASGWALLHSELEALSCDERESLGLTPDHAFFWRIAYELLSSELLTEYRLSVLKSIRRPVDYFGNFVDPEASGLFAGSDGIRFCGSVDYTTELPETYGRYAVWVDATNTPYVDSCGSKVLNCFAAGSFMLIEYNADYHATLGGLAERFMYRDRDELNAKIEHYLTCPRERAETIAAMQAFIEEGPRISRLLDRACSELAVARS